MFSKLRDILRIFTSVQKTNIHYKNFSAVPIKMNHGQVSIERLLAFSPEMGCNFQGIDVIHKTFGDGQIVKVTPPHFQVKYSQTPLLKYHIRDLDDQSTFKFDSLRLLENLNLSCYFPIEESIVGFYPAQIVNTSLRGVSFSNEDGSSRQELLKQCKKNQVLFFKANVVDSSIGIYISREKCIGFIESKLANRILEAIAYSRYYLTGKILDITGEHQRYRGCYIELKIYSSRKNFKLNESRKRKTQRKTNNHRTRKIHLRQNAWEAIDYAEDERNYLEEERAKEEAYLIEETQREELPVGYSMDEEWDYYFGDDE